MHDRDPRARDGTTPDRAGAPLPAGPRRVPRPGPGERRSRDVFVRRMAIVGAAAAVGWALYLARHALRLAYAAMLVSVALSPLVAWLERRALPSVLRHRPPRAVAILLLVVTVLGCIGGLGFLILSPLVAQAHDLVGALPGLVDQAQAFAARHGLLQHPVSITQVVANAPTAKIVGATTATAGHVLVIAGELFALLFLTFYVLVEAPDLFRRGMELVPEAHRAEARRACRVITEKVSAWLTGHVLLGLIVGGTAAAALALLGIPYFFVFGAISFLGEFLPYVGPLLSAIPATGVALSISWTKGLEVLAFFVAHQQFENHVLVPQIFEHQVGLSAAVVIVAVLIGAELLGIVGVVLAVPTAAIVQVVVDELAFGRPARPASEPPPA